MSLTRPRPRTRIVLLASACLVAAGVSAQAQQREPPPSRAALQYSYSPIVRKAAPAVVNVYVRSRVQTIDSPFANDPIFRMFGQGFGIPRERVQSSLGSGVIISGDGVIVTNTHVVKGGTDTQIRVALADKREFDAKIVAQDDKTDLAVLKIDSHEGSFPFLEFSNSDQIEVGDVVLAIGNPFGVGQTVTSGIISALTRTEMAQSDTQVFLQTDAAINPGNSGGALVDMQGKLVGINTMIFSQTGGSVGIGFAIPSNLVRLVADNAIAGRKIERPWLGAQIDTVTREMAENLGIERISGAVVTSLSKNGPAAQAGLELGDVIVSVDGFEVGDAHSVHYRLTTKGVGNTQPPRRHPQKAAHPARHRARHRAKARQGRRAQSLRQQPLRRRARIEYLSERRRRVQPAGERGRRGRCRAQGRCRRTPVPAGRHHRAGRQDQDHRRRRPRRDHARSAAVVERRHQARRPRAAASTVRMT